jgi:hypothetical protein
LFSTVHFNPMLLRKLEAFVLDRPHQPTSFEGTGRGRSRPSTSVEDWTGANQGSPKRTWAENGFFPMLLANSLTGLVFE